MTVVKLQSYWYFKSLKSGSTSNATVVKVGLHLQLNRRKSLRINDGCVAGGAIILRRLSCRWSPGIRCTSPPSLSLNRSMPGSTRLPSSTKISSITPAAGDGTGIEVCKQQRMSQHYKQNSTLYDSQGCFLKNLRTVRRRLSIVLTLSNI